MIAFSRTASYTAKTFGSAMAFAHEVCGQVKKVTGVDVRVSVAVAGNPQRIRWSAEFDNLGALEAAMKKLMSDQAYLQMVAQASDSFIEGSLVDEMWASV